MHYFDDKVLTVHKAHIQTHLPRSKETKKKKKNWIELHRERKPFRLSDMSALPFASYSSPDLEKQFAVDPSNHQYQTTDGATTGPSPHVLNAGQVDKDKPASPKKLENGEFTALGSLRAQLTGLQDDINKFLTDRMEHAKRKKARLEEDKERDTRINKEISDLLDGGDDDNNDVGRKQ